MGTAKKLVLASLISAMMVFMFAVGLMPATETLGVFASDDGPKDIRDILDALLGRSNGEPKGLNGVATINQPPSGSTVRILEGSTRALLPVQVSANTYAVTRVGIDGVINPVSRTWTGDLASPMSPIAAGEDGTTVTYVDLASVPSVINTSMAGAATMHTMYGLAQQVSKIDIQYDILTQIPLSVQIVSDLMNPFQELQNGETYLATETGLDGTGTLYTVFADLNVTGGLPGEPAKGLVDDTLNGVVSVPIVVGSGADAVTILVQSASLADYRAAVVDAMANPLIGLFEQAVLVVQVASSLESLVGTDEAADAGDLPNAVAFGGQFVQIAILYTTDNGAGVNFTELEMLPEDLPVILSYRDIDIAKQISPPSGAAIWALDSIVDSTPQTGMFIDVPEGSEWEKRTGSTLDSFNQVLEIYLNYTSVFIPLESLLVIDEVVPPAGLVAGGETVEVLGSFPVQDGVADVDAYSVFFGDPNDPTREAPVTGATQNMAGDTIISLEVTVPPSTSINDNVVDVSVFDNSTPSDFTSLANAYTYAGEPLVIDITPNVGPLMPVTPISINGVNLTTTQSVTFGGVPGTNISVNQAGTSISVLPPPVAAPTIVDVTVTTVGGMVTVMNGFEYVSPPAIDDFNPKVGPVAGGQQVVIEGMNLSNVISVTLAGFSADTIFDTGGGDSLVIITGPGAPGATGVVSVVTAGGTAMSEDFYTYSGVADPVMVNSISPDNAWVFGGITAAIRGSGFTGAQIEKGSTAGTLEVTFNGTMAEVIEVRQEGGEDVAIVRVPSVNIGTAGSQDVDVTVTRTNGGTTSDTLEDSFTYFRFFEDNSFITTAQSLANGSGTVNIVLDPPSMTTPGMNAQLVVPPVTGQTGARHVLARASMQQGSFGTAPPGTGTGVNLADTYAYFDVHVYTDVAVTTGGGTTTGGMSTVMEVTNNFTFTNNNPALLSTPLGSTAIPLMNAQTGRVILFTDTQAGGAATSLNYPNPQAGATFTQGTMERYQSQLENDEYNDNGSALTDLVGGRLNALGTVVLRDQVVINFAQLGLETPFVDGPTSGRFDRTHDVTIRSNDGALGYVSMVGIEERNGAKVISRTVTTGLTNATGENEFLFGFTMPTVGEPGTVDFDIFVPANATAPAVTIPNAFTFTAPPVGPGIGDIFLGIALAILVLVGLAGKDGGGSGGPCFIATAAYGTPMAAEIDTLREFRDAYLLNNAAGSAFVDVYYSVSPAVADVVAKSPVLAAAVRLVLTPVIYLAKISLAMPALSVALALMVSAMALMRRNRRKQQQS